MLDTERPLTPHRDDAHIREEHLKSYRCAVAQSSTQVKDKTACNRECPLGRRYFIPPTMLCAVGRMYHYPLSWPWPTCSVVIGYAVWSYWLHQFIILLESVDRRSGYRAPIQWHQRPLCIGIILAPARQWQDSTRGTSASPWIQHLTCAQGVG